MAYAHLDCVQRVAGPLAQEAGRARYGRASRPKDLSGCQVSSPLPGQTISEFTTHDFQTAADWWLLRIFQSSIF